MQAFLKHWATVNKHFLYTVSTCDIMVPDTWDKLYVFIIFETVDAPLFLLLTYYIFAFKYYIILLASKLMSM